MTEQVSELELLETFEKDRRRGPNPQRQELLNRLARRRAEQGPAKLYAENGDDFAWAALAIPELDYYVLIERFPDLNSPDHEIQKRAWIKHVINSGLAREMGWLVDDSIGRRKANHGIIVR